MYIASIPTDLICATLRSDVYYWQKAVVGIVVQRSVLIAYHSMLEKLWRDRYSGTGLVQRVAFGRTDGPITYPAHVEIVLVWK